MIVIHVIRDISLPFFAKEWDRWRQNEITNKDSFPYTGAESTCVGTLAPIWISFFSFLSFVCHYWLFKLIPNTHRLCARIGEGVHEIEWMYNEIGWVWMSLEWSEEVILLSIHNGSDDVKMRQIYRRSAGEWCELVYLWCQPYHLTIIVSFFSRIYVLLIQLSACQLVSLSACQHVSMSACQHVSMSACQHVSMSAS